MTTFKTAVKVRTLAALPSLVQLSGCGSIVAAFFAIALPLGLLALGLFLVLVGWVIR